MTSYGLFDVTLHRGGAPVLQRFTLELPPAGTLCLLGPSGCGKTTALLALAGLLIPKAGRISAPPHGQLGVQFQEDRLLPWRTARENIALIPGAIDADDILQALGMGEMMNKPAANMSGGQKRRVALARALAAPSALLLLDEPFKGLDDQVKQAAVDLVRRHAARKPCLVITHDAQEAAALQGEIIRMEPLATPALQG